MVSKLVDQVSGLEQLLQGSKIQLADLSSERDIFLCKQQKVLYGLSVNVLNAFTDLVSTAALFRRGAIGLKAWSTRLPGATRAREALNVKLGVLQKTFTQIDSAFSNSLAEYERLALRLKQIHTEDVLALLKSITETNGQVDKRLRNITEHIDQQQEVFDGLSQHVTELRTRLKDLEKEEISKKKSGREAQISSNICFLVGLSAALFTPIFPPVAIVSAALICGGGVSQVTSLGFKIHNLVLEKKCKKVSKTITREIRHKSGAKAALKMMMGLKHKLDQLACSSNDLLQESFGLFQSSRNVELQFCADGDRSTDDVVASNKFSTIYELIDTDLKPQELVHSIGRLALDFHESATTAHQRSELGEHEKKHTEALLNSLKLKIDRLYTGSIGSREVGQGVG